jgi:hypothetical protein
VLLFWSFTHYFAAPGKVEGLSLNPGSHNIIVNWEKPTLNSDCVTNYIIEWVNTMSGIGGSQLVSSDQFSYTIEDLDPCEENAVSVKAVNAKGGGADAVTGKTTTETAGNCHTHDKCPYGKVPVCPFTDPEFSVFFPHPTDRHWFFHCSNGVAYCKECPADLHWKNELEKMFETEPLRKRFPLPMY